VRRGSRPPRKLTGKRLFHTAGAELSGGFDLVHSHDWLVADAARRLARRWSVPWLVTVHATEFGRHQGWVDEHPQSHIHGVEHRMVRGADRVITCSAYMREHVAEAFGIAAGSVTVIPNGIDPTDLLPVADLPRLRASFAAPGEKLVLLVGRLVYEKGFHLALDAMPGLIDRLGDVRFLVADSGTAEAELKDQARTLGLMEHGTFVGWTGDDLLHSLYRIADLCVVPSIYEPFGLVRWRRWRRAARASWPTPVGCARSCQAVGASGCDSARATPSRSRGWPRSC
jgi:glycogen(starch) synthase